ncbi:MAG: signal peptidase II [Deltaproteobacteria bacterium]|nr:MAG: signal peptidase II [Deltaproteobacteria bacterium]
MNRSLAIVVAIGILWALADQVTKYLAVAHLTALFPPGASLGERIALFYRSDHLYHLATDAVPVIDGFWQHRYVQNPAGAFGLFSSAPLWARRALFLGVAGLALVAIVWMARRARAAVTRLSLGLVLGGAIGNFIDRAVHGYVIDFIDWHYQRWHWPAFNLADVGIVAGVIGLLLFLHRDPLLGGSEARGEPDGLPPEVGCADGAPPDS